MNAARSSGASAATVQFMRALRRTVHTRKQTPAGDGCVYQLAARIALNAAAANQAAAFQTCEHVGHRGAIDADLIGEGCLIEARLRVGNCEDAVLHGRDAERLALLGE